MTDTYKVRMTVLALIAADEPYDATQGAVEMAADAGLTVLRHEEPEKVKKNYVSGSAEGDIYP